MVMVSSIAQMNQKKMEKIVKEKATSFQGEKGFVEFTYNNLKMYLISDVKHDRMRIITPVTEYGKISFSQLEKMMVSNFHLALDARYAMSEGVLYSAYIHPLSSLKKNQLESAVDQVSNLATSFGSTYSSGELQFGGN